MRGGPASRWRVYIVACAKRSYYTGITNDLGRRLRAHNLGRGGRYTRSFGPVKLVWKEQHPDRSSASRREAQIKSWTHAQKAALIRRAPEGSRRARRA